MRIDLVEGQIAFSTGSITHRRLAALIALVHARSSSHDQWVTGEQICSVFALNPTSLRTTLHRLRRKAELLGQENPIEAEHWTAGPWWQSEGPSDQIEVFANAKRLSHAEILDFLLPHQVPLPLLDDRLNPSVLDLDDLDTLLEADQQYQTGDIKNAAKRYGSLARRARGIASSAAAARLLQTHRRLEAYPDLLRQAAAVKRLAKKEANVVVGHRLQLSSVIARSHYAYHFQKRYDVALQGLLDVAEEVKAGGGLYIDWLNLYGLVLRRLALEAFGQRHAEEEAKRLARGSVRSLYLALELTTMLGSPFQVQQVAANLANVLGLFAHAKYGLYDEPGTPVRRALRLIRTSTLVFERFKVGQDDILNTIFVLSIARRHGVSREDSAWDDAGLPQLKRGLAVFGASEFDRLDPLGPFGSEQAAQLAFEICWAAIDETRIDIFSRFATRLREAIADLNQRQAGPIANEVKTLKAHARKRYGRSGPWLRALAELS